MLIQSSTAKSPAFNTNLIIIIIMYIYYAPINALSAHMIHINLNVIFYTHVEHSPTKTIYIKYYKNNNNLTIIVQELCELCCILDDDELMLNVLRCHLTY